MEDDENVVMFKDRMRARDTQGIVYHYCSADTFLKIIENRSIRYSDINMMNDAHEGHWGYRIFELAASKLLNHERLSDITPGLDTMFFDYIDNHWTKFGLLGASFIACFSSDGDSLSQWRAYADDGRGIAIGFEASELMRQPIQMLDVLYEEEKQVEEMMVALGGLYLEFLDRGKDHTQSWFGNRCFTMIASAIAFKNPAWRDEKEVRCQHLIDVLLSDNEWRLVDAGGLAAGQKVEGERVQFQARRGAITAFVDLPFEVSEERRPIREVVLGPRCPSGPGNIQFVLGNNGYGFVPIRNAGSAYRA